MKTTIIEEDEDTNPQLTEKLFIKSEYIFVPDIMNKKDDNIISTALTDTKTYASYFNKFNHFSHTFHFLIKRTLPTL